MQVESIQLGCIGFGRFFFFLKISYPLVFDLGFIFVPSFNVYDNNRDFLSFITASTVKSLTYFEFNENLLNK